MLSSSKRNQEGKNNPNWKGGYFLNKNVYKVEREKRLRNEVINLLGNVCVKCGFPDKRALQIDHINGNGRLERRGISNRTVFYKIVCRSVKNKENKYQLLCANCNWIKKVENNE